MRVLHLITDFSEKGGAERMLARLIQETPQVEHHLVSLMQVSGIYSDALSACESYQAMNWRLKTTPLVMLKLARSIVRLRPDVIQCWMYHANAIGAISALISGQRSRLIWGVRHSLDSFQEESFSTKLALRVGNILSSIPRASIYCSDMARSQHQKFGYSTASDLYIPNGVDIGAYGTLPQLISKDEFGLTVGCAGRFHEAKGYEYLLRAIALVHAARSDIRFVLAGRGVENSNLAFMSLVDRHKVDLGKVTLCGDVKDMPSFYKGIDVLVQSSITEGFPNVLVEAMASRTPCIATDVGDSREIIGDTGFVVPSRDSESLADAIVHYAGLLAEEKKNYGRLARARVESRYDISVAAARYMDVWANIGALDAPKKIGEYDDK